MKQAKQRMHPLLAQLKTSTRRAKRALSRGLAGVSASNDRMRRNKPRFTLAELIAQSPGGLYIDKGWDQAPPVGREML